MATSISKATTSFQYARDDPIFDIEKPYMILTHLLEAQRDTNLEWERGIEEEVTNIRGSEQNYSLDEHGFTFRQSPIWGFSDWKDREKVEKIHLPEMEELLKTEVEGADEVMIFDWRLRTAATTPNCQRKRKAIITDLNNPTDAIPPASMVHLDQSPVGTLKRIRLLMGERASLLLAGRVRIINIWRPLHTVQNWPLVLADGKTMNYDDLYEVDLIRRNYVGSTMYAKYRPGYKWYFMDYQRPDEVCLFKNFDSSEDVPAQICPHVSFPLRDVSTYQPPRESIEIRAFVFTNP